MSRRIALDTNCLLQAISRRSRFYRANNVVRVDARFRFGLIEANPDDNKFVDCAA